MNLKTRLQRFLTKSFFGLGDPITWSARDWQAALSGQMMGEVTLADLLRNGTVVAAASLIADSLASVPLRVVQYSPSGAIKPVTQSDAVTSLLSFGFDDRSASVYQCATQGNGYVHRDPTTGDLYALSTQAMAMLDSQGNIWIRDFNSGPYSYDEICHYKWRHSPKFAIGYAATAAASDTMTAALGVVRMTSRLSANLAAAGVILEAPMALSDKAIKNIKDSYNEAVGGSNVGKAIVLEEGTKLSNAKAPTLVESDVGNAWEHASAEICRVYQIPPELLGLNKDSNRATAAESARQFSQRCLNAWSHRTGDKLSRLLLTKQERAAGLVVIHDLEELSLGQGKERADYLSALVATGILVSDEARASIGYEKIAGGNVLRAPVNTAPATASNTNGAHPPNGAGNGAAAGP